MREVVALCRQLDSRLTKAKRMKVFEAPFGTTPTPHTWGEVALVQARLLSGSWQPGEHVWIRVVHEKKILGDGRLNKGWFIGEDKSDLPQRKAKRPMCLDYEYEYTPDEYVEVKEVVYGLEISKLHPLNPKTEEQISLERQKAKEDLWKAIDLILEKALTIPSE
jgi:hypothetical protein